MIDLLDKDCIPKIEQISDCVKNPVFDMFCNEIKTKYQCAEQIEYSSCSMERGWNVKFKSSSKSLCTIYPKENYFTVLIVVGKKEKDKVECILPACSSKMQELYNNTREWNNQRWLMIDMEDHDSLYEDVLKLIDIRKMSK